MRLSPEEFAQFAAAHSLLLLAAAILILSVTAAAVLAVGHLAVKHSDRLWMLIDAFVPGDIWRPRTYLLVYLALGFVLTMTLVALAAITRGVSTGSGLAAFDLAFAEALSAEVSPGWRSFFWLFTWLGSYLPVTAMAGAAMWRLLSRRRRLLAGMWAISQAGGLAISETLKVAVARGRPSGADPLLYGGSASFPSGHAMASFVLCGVGAYILLRTIRSWRSRVLLVSAALAWCLAMGFSRLYLGVHYFTDVAAGFLAGAAWVAVCVSGMEVARRGREL